MARGVPRRGRRLSIAVSREERKAVEYVAKQHGLEGRGAGSLLIRRYIQTVVIPEYRTLTGHDPAYAEVSGNRIVNTGDAVQLTP